MRWPRRTRRGPSIEASTARVKAQAALEHTRSQTPRYAALARSLRELRERNHFAESIEASFRGGKT